MCRVEKLAYIAYIAYTKSRISPDIDHIFSIHFSSSIRWYILIPAFSSMDSLKRIIFRSVKYTLTCLSWHAQFDIILAPILWIIYQERHSLIYRSFDFFIHFKWNKLENGDSAIVFQRKVCRIKHSFLSVGYGIMFIILLLYYYITSFYYHYYYYKFLAKGWFNDLIT